MKYIIACFLLACCLSLSHAVDFSAAKFASTPVPTPLQMMSPCALTVNPAGTRGYVLDRGLRCVSSFSADGQFLTTYPLPAEIDCTDSTAGALLPTMTLVATKDTLYLLHRDSDSDCITLTALDGPGISRTVLLPQQAQGGAFTLDAAGRLLVAYLSLAGGKLELALAREGTDGTVGAIAALRDPCEGQWKELALTGFTTAPDGRIAIGIGQRGGDEFSFIRSWLLQGKLQNNTLTGELRIIDHESLLDNRGRLRDRFKILGEMAGRNGFPAKPCVPLFTNLAFSGKIIVTGGNTVDPFLRIYQRDDPWSKGNLLTSIPRKVGSSVALLTDKKEPGILIVNPENVRIDELSLDGRVVNSFGRAVPYSLSTLRAMAADKEGVYLAAEWNDMLHLLRFSADGTFRWARDIAPPEGMEGAEVYLATPSGERVMIGWRQPNAAGIGWVDVMQDDGLPGLPFWTEAYTDNTPSNKLNCPIPIIAGNDGKIYLLRETKSGPRVQVFSVTGAFVLPYPATLQGITAVDGDGLLAWAHYDEENLVISRFDRQGEELSWKRVPRKVKNAMLWMASADGWWGWLSSTDTLLRFDETMNLTEEATVFTPDGKRIEAISAIAGDQQGCIYLAQPDNILVIKNPGK